jgi:hypothetical protein
MVIFNSAKLDFVQGFDVKYAFENSDKVPSGDIIFDCLLIVQGQCFAVALEFF